MGKMGKKNKLKLKKEATPPVKKPKKYQETDSEEEEELVIPKTPQKRKHSKEEEAPSSPLMGTGSQESLDRSHHSECDPSLRFSQIPSHLERITKK